MVAAPSLICIGGMSGTGKSTLARAVHAQIKGSAHIDSDVSRKQMWNVAMDAKLPAEAYTPENNTIFDAHFLAQVDALLKTHDTVIVSMTFSRPHLRDSHKALAVEHKVQFTPIWLQASKLDDIYTRIDKRAALRNDASDITTDLVKALQKDLVKADAGWPILDANLSQEKALVAALDIIQENKTKHLYNILIDSAPVTGKTDDFIAQQRKITMSVKRAIRKNIKAKNLSGEFTTAAKKTSHHARAIPAYMTENAASELRHIKHIQKIEFLY